MTNPQDDFNAYLKEQLSLYGSVMVPVKASLFNRIIHPRYSPFKLHPNPEDEFCDPSIGPNYGIINATRHLREAQAGRSSTLPQKLPSHYRISLHVDDEAIVVNLGRQYGYNVIQIDAPDDGWKEKIIAKAEEIRHREFDQQ